MRIEPVIYKGVYGDAAELMQNNEGNMNAEFQVVEQAAQMEDQQQMNVEQLQNMQQQLQNPQQLQQEPQQVQRQMSEQEKLIRETITEREALRDKLQEDGKTGGDSGEMKKVKESLKELQRVLHEGDENFNTSEAVEKLKSAYQMAISNCKKYCETKNPWTATGKRRLRMIKEELKRLQEEKPYIDRAAVMIAQVEQDPQRKLPIEVKTPQDLLVLAQMDMTMDMGNVDRMMTQDVAGIHALTFEDFAALAGTKNRGVVSFENGKLRISENHAYHTWDAYQLLNLLTGEDQEKTVLNRQMLERFFVVAEERLKDTNPNYIPYLRSEMEKQLNMKAGQKKSGAVSRSTLVSFVTWVEEQSSLISKVKKEGEQQGKEYELALVAEEVLARTEEEKQALEQAEKDVEKENLTVEQNKTKIHTILENAKKQGVPVPSLSTHQMDNLATANMSLIGDQIFEAMRKVYQYVLRMNGGLKESQPAKDCAFTEEEKKKLAAIVIIRFTAMTEEGKDFWGLQLQNEIQRLAFQKARQTEEENAEQIDQLEKNYDRLSIEMLAQGGAEGLDELVDRHFPNAKKWKGAENQKRVRHGVACLKKLCDGIREISQLQQTAFSEGLSEKESTRLKELGVQVQQLLQEENAQADMELVTGELKTSRFYHGFEQIKGMLGENGQEEAFSYETATQILADHMTVQGKADAEQPKKLSPELDEKLSVLSEQAGRVIQTLMLEERPSGLVEREKDPKEAKSTADSIRKVKDTLRRFPVGENCAKNVRIAGVDGKLIQTENNQLYFVVDNQAILLSRTAQQLANNLEDDMMAHTDLYGEDFVKDVVKDMDVLGEAPGKLVRSRILCIKYLAGRTKKPEIFFNNVHSVMLKKFVEDLLDGHRRTEQDIISEINMFEQNVHLNGQETLELLEQMEQLGNKEAQVTFERSSVRTQTTENDWTEEEKKVQSLLADMIYSENTWQADRTSMDPGKRLQLMMLNHQQTLSHLAKDDSSLIRIMKTMELPENMQNWVIFNLRKLFAYASGSKVVAEAAMATDFTEEERRQLTSPLYLMRNAVKLANADLREEDIQKGITEGFTEQELREKGLDIVADHQNSFSQMEENLYQRLMAPEYEGVEMSEEMIKAALSQEKTIEFFKEFEERLDEKIEENTKELQGTIKEAAAQIFRSEEKAPEEEVKEKPKTTAAKEADVPLTEEEEKKKKAEQLRESKKKLDQILVDAANGSEGQGLFMKNVLSNYFTAVTIGDKRAMLASALRNIKPVPDDQEALSEEEKEALERKRKGEMLGGYLKGAGPLLHKMLQGMPDVAIPEEMETAIKDMKSNLAPIPERIVEAQLQNIINSSNGRITKIKVQKALGAASVGQTFLCTIYGPGMEEEEGNGKDVVIKLLRPDVANRMMREKEVMLKCARMTDRKSDDISKMEPGETKGGMEATYEGQLLRIEEELDLSIEAKNVQKGAIYDKGYKTVKAMKVNTLVEPTANTLMLEKAPGTTVDKYLEEVKTKKEEIFQHFFTTNAEGKLEVREEYRDRKAEDWKDFTEARLQLQKILGPLQIRQKYLTQMCENWVMEGVYGEGFYHGDLHAGNIMVDDNGITMIDFGNATTLDEKQRTMVTRMVMAAAMGNAELFLESFHKLLENTPEKVYKEKEAKLLDTFKEIFALGDMTSSGQRIAAALLKAQTLGIEVPPAIFNFSQSQMRLQNTVDSVNAQITSMQEACKCMDAFTYAETLKEHQRRASNFNEFCSTLLGGLNGKVTAEEKDNLLRNDLCFADLQEVIDVLQNGERYREYEENRVEEIRQTLRNGTQETKKEWLQQLSVDEKGLEFFRTRIELYKKGVTKAEYRKFTNAPENQTAARDAEAFGLQKIHIVPDGSPKSDLDVLSDLGGDINLRAILLLDRYFEMKENPEQDPVELEEMEKTCAEACYYEQRYRKDLEATKKLRDEISWFYKGLNNAKEGNFAGLQMIYFDKLKENPLFGKAKLYKEKIEPDWTAFQKLCENIMKDQQEIRNVREGKGETKEQIPEIEKRVLQSMRMRDRLRIKISNAYSEVTLDGYQNLLKYVTSTVDGTTPKDFVDVMGNLITGNLKSSIRKLGRWTAVKNRNAFDNM